MPRPRDHRGLPLTLVDEIGQRIVEVHADNLDRSCFAGFLNSLCSAWSHAPAIEYSIQVGNCLQHFLYAGISGVVTAPLLYSPHDFHTEFFDLVLKARRALGHIQLTTRSDNRELR